MFWIIAPIVLGLIFLISGKVKWGNNLFLEGQKARLAGLVFLAPVGIVLLTFVLMTVLESTGRISDTKSFEQAINSFISSFAINGFMIGLAYINFYSVSRDTKVRGGCLTYFIIFWALVAIYSIFFIVTSRSNAQWFIYASIGTTFFEELSFVGIWLWKKIGVFSYCIFTLMGPIFSFFRYGSILQPFLTLIADLSFILVIYLLVKPKWQFFE